VREVHFEGIVFEAGLDIKYPLGLLDLRGCGIPNNFQVKGVVGKIYIDEEDRISLTEVEIGAQNYAFRQKSNFKNIIIKKLKGE
jgi:hypothetical protein